MFVFVSVKTPVTKEEKAHAARKYGMIEEDYEPYDPEETQMYMGDYPKLKAIGADERSGFHNWDMQWLKKDFGEPMHADFDVYQGTRTDSGRKLVPPWKALCYFLGIFGPLLLLGWFGPSVNFPLSKQQLSHDGRKYYTFERTE